ncbi:MAG: amidophosphoribosyltransferase [Burkholderiaceae bacterium]|nr:amidophosphoribosyltransferase [Burkholderiaceae bacterium]
MPTRLRKTWRSIESSLLPAACALCGAAATDGVCDGCSTQFFGLRPARCTQCANRLPHDGAGAICGACLKLPPAFDATWVAADYAPPVDQLVLALKFGHSLALAPLLARLLQATLPGEEKWPDLLLPVPLAPARLAGRGFNQSLEIARHLSRRLAVPLEPKLAIRLRETATQSLLPLPERRDNVRRAFTLDATAIERIRGRHVGLVDDVMTTGETLNELAAVCKRFGAARVTNLVFARAQP